jgi:hypothetical protein
LDFCEEASPLNWRPFSSEARQTKYGACSRIPRHIFVRHYNRITALYLVEGLEAFN